MERLKAMNDLDREERLMVTITEGGELVGLGRTTMYDLIARKEIPVVRVGKAVRIPVAALREWVKRQTAAAA